MPHGGKDTAPLIASVVKRNDTSDLRISKFPLTEKKHPKIQLRDGSLYPKRHIHQSITTR